jgi:hypothetical protein
MPASSLRALLERSIDYAGLFPPAEIALDSALHNQAGYVRSVDAWMLSTFVLPAAKFSDVDSGLLQFDQKKPLQISALGPKSENASDFQQNLGVTAAAIREFAAEHGDVISIRQLEMPLPKGTESGLLADARSVLKGLRLQTFWEAPPAEAERTIALLSEHNRGEAETLFGYKLRTGGVTEDAFPTSEQIGRALVASAQNAVPIKFTAGLHHPIRQFRTEVQTKMHGFLNVLGAAILAGEHKWDDKITATMLEDEDADSFSFVDEFFAWREWKIDTKAIIARRRFVTSFGSCSFDEPRDDLRALELL